MYDLKSNSERIELLTGSLDYLYSADNWTKDMIYSLNDSYYLLTDSLDSTVGALEAADIKLDTKVADLTANLAGMRAWMHDRLAMRDDRFNKTLSALAYSHNLNAYFNAYHMTASSLYMSQLDEFQSLLDKFELITNAITLSELNPSVISSTQFQKILDKVDDLIQQTTSEWELLSTIPMGGKYAIPGVQYFSTKTQLIAMIPIMLRQKVVETKQVFSIQTVPVPAQRTEQGMDYTSIHPTPMYLAMGRETFIEMSAAELARCIRVHSQYYCLSTHVVYPITKPTCVAAILLGFDSHTVVAKCESLYHYEMKPLPRVLEGPDSFVLSGLSDYSWHLVCGPTNKVLSVEADHYVILPREKLCDCALTAGPYYLPKRASRCSRSSGLSEFSFHYTINKLVYDHMTVENTSWAETLSPFVSQQLKYKVHMNFTRPELDLTLPPMVETNVLQPTPPPRHISFKKLTSIMDTKDVLHPTESYFLSALRESGTGLRHASTMEKVQFASHLFILVFSGITLTVLGYHAYRYLRAKCDPDYAMQDALVNLVIQLRRVAPRLPELGGILTPYEAVALFTAWDQITKRAQVKADPVPRPAPMDRYEHPTVHLTPAPTPTLPNAIADGILLLKAHEVAWVVLFILTCLLATAYWAFRLFGRESNFVHRFFPAFARKVDGRALTEIILSITDPRNGRHLLAKIKTVGLTPYRP